MGFTTSHLHTALQRPPPPAPMTGPRRFQPQPFRSLVPPPPWIMQRDPFVVLLVLESPLLALLLLKALIG